MKFYNESFFKRDIGSLKGVGEKTIQAFSKLGIFTFEDLIKFYPRSYEDWTSFSSIASAEDKKDCCLKVKIVNECIGIKLKDGRWLFKIKVSDGLDNLNMIFFNSRYPARNLVLGKEYLIKGKVVKHNGEYEMLSPKVKGLENEFSITPIYNQCEEIVSSKISRIIKNLINCIDEPILETLPDSVLENYGLDSKDFCYRNIHFPKDILSLKRARKRIIFEEFFIYYLSMSSLKVKFRQKTNVVISESFFEEFCEIIPFKLTESQKKVILECFKDINEKGLSMNRLLQGDVGSGKTLVAAALMYAAVKNGYQAALMVPTELLARQHYKTFCSLLSGTGVKINIICGALRAKARKALYEEILLIKSGIIIGTHSLISEGIQFGNLGLIITDEQHRFGVKQRAKLISKGKAPHVLIMSATPIPRTLAMILYEDLDVSILEGVIPGRQKIKTYRIDSTKRSRMFGFLQKTVLRNEQAYIVCASIEERNNGIIDLVSYKELLIKSGGFKAEEIEILHGKMSPYEKDYIMNEFLNNNIKVLISTTVIEVGIDVPNATVMVIENAERFGLSQLHQLRGRVGRGNKQSYCILVSDSNSKDAIRRFSAMKDSCDGFYLSEEDLQIRGPGDFFGVNQHGVPNIKMSTTFQDIPVIQAAHDCAKKLIENDPFLQSPEFKFIRSEVNELSNGSSELNFKVEGVVF